MISSCRWKCLVIILLAVSLASVHSAPSFARAPRDSDDSDKRSSKGRDKSNGGPKKEEDGGTSLFEGDIMLTEVQKEALPADESSTIETDLVRAKRSLNSVTPSPGKAIHQTWSNAIVPYVMSALLDARYRIMFMEAMRTIQNGTCIRFIHRTEQENYLVFDKDYEGECKSYVGCLGGPQKVTLADGCASVGNALHELGHALGLWHEHSRLDRDNYIEVVYENLRRPEDEKHFRKTSVELFKSVPDVGYDLESVMHYSPFAFARETNGNDLRTIRIREDADLEELNCLNRLPMGQRIQLSYKDKKRLNTLYQCRDVNIVKPICVTPTPTPTPTVTSSEETTPTTVVIPTPTSTRPPPPPLDRRLRTRNYVTLTLIEENEDAATVYDAHGMKCVPSPGCTPVPCLGSICKSIPNQFQIIKTNEEDGGQSIRSWNTVVLRSVNDYSHFLDCSNPANCVVSECREDNDVEDPNNASYVSSCANHKFEIIGIRRKKGKVLNTSHKIQFRKPNTDGGEEQYLSCNGKRCHLKRDGDCPTQRTILFSPPRDSLGRCPIDAFNVTKLAES